MSDKHKNDKDLEIIFKSSGLEKAPKGFTENVMDRIVHEAQTHVKEYKPIIGKRIWIGIGLFYLLLISLPLLVRIEAGKWLKNIDLKVLNIDLNVLYKVLTHPHFTGIVIFASIVLAALLAVDIWGRNRIIKNNRKKI